METLSIWDQKNRKFIRRGFKPAKVTSEFQRTKKLRIFDHTLGEINFNAKLELNNERNETISRDIKKLDSSGFLYESIGNVYFPDGELLRKNSQGEFEVYSHGEPVPGDLSGGNENCATQGLRCADGTDKDCAPGKCIIGKLKKISNYKWKYTSENSYEGTKLEYFIGGKEFVELKTIIRGTYINPDGTELKINKPASKGTTIFLPPANYIDKVFTAEILKIFNYTLELSGEDPLIGIVYPEEDFIRQVLDLAYKDLYGLETGPTYSSLCDAAVSEEVVNAINDLLFSLDKVWKEAIGEIMDERWLNRFVNHETNREFITYVFRDLKEMFTQCFQITTSGVKQSRIKNISDENVRPIYFRLPEASGGYRSEESENNIVIGEEADRFNLPISSLEIGTIVTTTDRKIAFKFLPRVINDTEERTKYKMSPIVSSRTKEELYSPLDPNSWYKLLEDDLPPAPVAKWILSGADEFLREKKYDIESFYYTYLDPTECSPKNLDWLAQHVGLSGPIWNTQWKQEHKRALIKNALGWFNEELETSIGGRTYKSLKGEVLQEHPFNTSTWRDEEATPNDEKDLSEISLSRLNQETFSVFKKEWKGLMETKGTLVSLVFLFSLFEIKSHSRQEVYELQDGEYIVNSGLRSYEASAPVLTPVKYDVAQVGDMDDALRGSFSNQLIAGTTAVANAEFSDNVFFRMPFYYNRNGKTWDTVESLIEYWTSARLNTRVQYAYLAADLWRQGDAYFDPRIIDESTTDANITLEDSNILTTESSDPIIAE